jgi:formiminotetrahydrofolate cyclodeaminase
LTGSQPSYGDMAVGTFLDALAAGTPAPAAGSAAALVLAQAAALCAKAASLSSHQLTADRAARLVGEAEQIRSRAASLIDEDPRAYQAVIEQTRRLGGQIRGESSAARSADGLAAALSAAADVPMQVVELAVPVASIAAVLAESGKPALRGDAISAGLLAQAAARAAAALVRVNLAGAPSDPRLTSAEAWLTAIEGHLTRGT